jgi:hypothetical protein
MKTCREYSRRWALGIALAVVPSLAAASTIGDLTASPQQYNGDELSVQGAVSNFHQTSGVQGKAYAMFSLCANACVRVYASGNPRVKNGDGVVVSGTFTMVDHLDGQVFYNVLETNALNIHSVSSIPVR